MAPHLPAEVILQISNNVGNKRDKSNLARTCRQFYAVLNCELYKDIQFGGLPQFKRLTCFRGYIRMVSGIVCVKSLVQTFLQRADLGKSVRKLEIKGWPTDGRWESGIADPESESALFGLVSRLSQTDEERDVWMDDLKTGNCDAWMPLLFFQTSENLQELLIVLSYYPWHAAPYVNRMLDRAALRTKPFDTVSPFPRLERVHVSNPRLDGGTMHRDLRPFFTFPMTKTIHTWQLCDDGRVEKRVSDERIVDMAPTVALAPRSSSIAHINIEDGRFFGGLTELIGACKDLKSLRFTDGGVCNSDQLEPAMLFDPLAGASDSIESLWLEFDNCGMPSASPMGSFADFTALRRLRISAPHLFKIADVNDPVSLHDILHQKLERLSLCRCGVERWEGGFQEAMEGLMQKLRDLVGETSHLKELHVECGFTGCRKSDEDQHIISMTDDLLLACEEKGIQLQVGRWVRNAKHEIGRSLLGNFDGSYSRHTWWW